MRKARTAAHAGFANLRPSSWRSFADWDFAGGYLGGVHAIEDVQAILDIESTFAADDWKQFAREIQYPQQNEFYYFRERRDDRAWPMRRGLNRPMKRR